MRKLQLMMVACLMVVLSGLAYAESNIAILVVGDNSKTAVVKSEKSLIDNMIKELQKQKPKVQPKVYSYHLDKDQDRNYCKKVLDILPEDALFVGLVQMDGKNPTEVLYRLDRIVSPPRAAADIMKRFELFATNSYPGLSTKKSTTSSTPPSAPVKKDRPVKKATKAPSSSQGHGWSVQVGSYTEVKYADVASKRLSSLGLDVRTESVVIGGRRLYKVMVGNYASRKDAQEVLPQLKEEGFKDAFPVEQHPE